MDSCCTMDEQVRKYKQLNKVIEKSSALSARSSDLTCTWHYLHFQDSTVAPHLHQASCTEDHRDGEYVLLFFWKLATPCLLKETLRCRIGTHSMGSKGAQAPPVTLLLITVAHCHHRVYPYLHDLTYQQCSLACYLVWFWFVRWRKAILFHTWRD